MRDLDAYASFLDPDAVWDATTLPATLEGATAIREFVEELIRSYEVYELTLQEVRRVGNGVVFYVILLSGRPTGSSSAVQESSCLHERVGGRIDGAHAVVARHRRGPCCRRTPRSETG